MRKSLIIVVVIAVLGLLSLYFTKNNTGIDNTNGAPTQSQANNAATPSPAVTSEVNNSNRFKDGTYKGTNQANEFGGVQVSVKISGGEISNVDLLIMPDGDSRSKAISDFAGPELVSKTIIAQSSDIDIITGATYTSQSYIQSLQAALDSANS